jgi:hypothetical protein
MLCLIKEVVAMIKIIILCGISVIMLFSYAALIAGHNADEQSERMYR